MCLLPIVKSPEAYVPIQGLSHGAVLTSTVDVRPLRARKIAVNGNFMCHTVQMSSANITRALSLCQQQQEGSGSGAMATACR